MPVIVTARLKPLPPLLEWLAELRPRWRARWRRAPVRPPAMNVAHIYAPVPTARGGLGLLIEAGAGPPRLVLRVSIGARAATCALDADGVAVLARIADDARLRLHHLATARDEPAARG